MHTLHYTGRYLHFVDCDGWEYVTRRNCMGVVVILAMTTNKEWLLVEQFRKPLNANVIECPAGLIGDNDKSETLLDSAKRELLEETGYEAKDWKYLFSGPSSSGLTDEIQHFYLASGCEKVTDKLGVDDEKIKLHVIPDEQLFSFLVDQSIVDQMLIDPKLWLLGDRIKT